MTTKKKEGFSSLFSVFMIIIQILTLLLSYMITQI
nr:MAG TPA: hypothetical protein [Caudoviricetes sp.]